MLRVQAPPWPLFYLGVLECEPEALAAADAALAELAAKWGQRWPEEVAQVHAYRGNVDGAFEWLDKADEETTGLYVDWQFDPLWKNLHGDPRWRALLEKTGAADIPLTDIAIKVSIPN